MLSFRKSTIVFASGLLLILIALGLSFNTIERQFLKQLAVKNMSTLRLVTVGLRGALQRFEPLPVLLANQKDMKWLFTSGTEKNQVDHLNAELKKIAGNFGASDIYVMDKTGLTISASNFDTDVSFIGEDFSYRPYFVEAMKGKPSRFFALGTTSLKRGYYFAAPIFSGSRILGVVAIKIGVDALEENWRGAANKIFVSDRNGVIFMSSEKTWLFKSLTELGDRELDEINESKQYPAEKLNRFEARITQSDVEELRIFQIKGADVSNSYLESRRAIPDAGWTLHVLAPESVATGQVYVVMVVAFLLSLLFLLVISIIIQRRARFIKNIEAQRKTQEQLELRVSERTDELNIANQKLTTEVGERIQTEKQLRSTQNELIQAGKLAALGQMSAALSHELNQPLTAVKSYADNARVYLERNKYSEARANIGRISEMVDRMAELGRHLRNFARKPQQKVDVVSLSAVFRSVDQIMNARLKENNAILDVQSFDENLTVMGGLVRLQQVMVNLINNALDAMEDIDQPIVSVSVIKKEDDVIIKVRDYGAGLDSDIIDNVFDPFFTTKGVNEGVGLGLSISYNIIRDFGGSLSVENTSEAGAVFIISLQQADQMQGAAE